MMPDLFEAKNLRPISKPNVEPFDSRTGFTELKLGRGTDALLS